MRRDPVKVKLNERKEGERVREIKKKQPRNNVSFSILDSASRGLFAKMSIWMGLI